ncbi:hypothetical protein SBA1_630033 [Candidatus Sulfotelmatobacter kueseliae]|uniref:Uncharacterized protein n=1 Tax=Candidatus Sulfotelmatobacter kueseliae TaxID=2042962 RepID=A0A2U3L2D2_9BACT|nr:hypothetical protein SBA1_630033 [Candidatus Sulfotelmatobacter kueseliae]
MGTAAPGCPVERSSTAQSVRATKLMGYPVSVDKTPSHRQTTAFAGKCFWRAPGGGPEADLALQPYTQT